MAEPTYKCFDCDSKIDIPTDALPGEIVSCPSCGVEYELKKKNGGYELTELGIEGEDWGE